MTNNTPITPSFITGYWRPWNENASIFDSYLSYIKDISLVKYGSDIVANYIKEGNQHLLNQAQSLHNQLSSEIESLQFDVENIQLEIQYTNRNLDLILEQNRLSHLVLKDLSALMKLPDKEKERRFAIELGLKFFTNAQVDNDLFYDALNEFLKAEQIMAQDFFVLHRIGYIYLFSEKHLNPKLALTYFEKAGKYASIESDENAFVLSNAIDGNSYEKFASKKNRSEKFKKIASISYEKAAFAAYVLGDFITAETLQDKAYNLHSSAFNKFQLAKYQIRNRKISSSLRLLNEASDEFPEFLTSALKEIDFINEPKLISFIKKKDSELNEKIRCLVDEYHEYPNSDFSNSKLMFKNYINLSYPDRWRLYHSNLTNLKKYKEERSEQLIIIENLKIEIETFPFEEFQKPKIELLCNDLIKIQFAELNILKDQLPLI